MTMTRFPHGISVFGVPVFGGGIAPTFGEVFYLVAAKASTDPYYARLSDAVDDDYIFSTLASAYAAMTSDQGDTLIVMPGDHIQTAGLTWAKNQTRVIGWGGPNLRVQPTTATTGGLRISTVTTAVSYLLNITGNYCQFANIATFNNGVATTNLGDVGITGKNNYFYRCDFRGGNNSTQNTATTPYAGVPVVFLNGAGYGNGTTFDECQIGSAGNSVRTHGPGAVLFLGGASSAAFDIQFKKCVLETYCQTLGADVALVKLNAAGYSNDRYMLFDECFFYNFWEGLADKMNYAIVDGCNTTHNIVLKRCTGSGIEFWSNVATYTAADMPDVADSGGITENVKVS